MTHDPYVPLVDAVRQAGVPYHTVYSAVQSGRLPAKEHKVGTVRKYEVRLSDLHLWREHRNPKLLGNGAKPTPTRAAPLPQTNTRPLSPPEPKEEPAVALPQPTAAPAPTLHAVAPQPPASAPSLSDLALKAKADLEEVELKMMELEDQRDELRSVVEAAERLSRYLEKGA